MEQEVYRHVPYDIDVEQALLGAIFVDNRAIERVSMLLRPEQFYDPLHQRLFEAIATSFERGRDRDHATDPARADESRSGAARSWRPFLSRQSRGGRARASQCPDYARILHDLWVRRTLIHIGEDIVNTAYEAPLEKPPQEQIAEAEKSTLPDSETSRYGDGPLDFAEALRRTVEIAEKAQQRGGRIFRSFERFCRHRFPVGRICSRQIF